MSAKNKAIRKAIDSLDLNEARNLLKTALKESPDADTHYLASLVALNDKQKQDFLQKAIELDPFHQEANSDLNKITKGKNQNSDKESNVINSQQRKPVSPIEQKNSKIFTLGKFLVLISLFLGIVFYFNANPSVEDCQKYNSSKEVSICLDQNLENMVAGHKINNVIVPLLAVSCGATILVNIGAFFVFISRKK